MAEAVDMPAPSDVASAKSDTNRRIPRLRPGAQAAPKVADADVAKAPAADVAVMAGGGMRCARAHQNITQVGEDTVRSFVFVRGRRRTRGLGTSPG